MKQVLITFIAKLREKARDYSFDVLLPNIYKRHARKPLDESKILFVEGKLAEMPDSFLQMWKYLSKNPSLHLEYYALDQLNSSYFAYFRNCRRLMVAMATARVVFLSDSSDIVSCVTMRPETFVCQLWHACGAFKKWGMSTVNQLFGGSLERHQKHPYYRNLNLVTVSSPEVGWAYREAMNLMDTPEVVQATGVSRTDVFFDREFIADAYAWLRDTVAASVGKKVILYAPTFRGAPFEAQAPDKLDITALCQALGGDYILLIKQHPYVKEFPAIPDHAKRFAYVVSEAPIDVLLTVSDICITDYSSVVFEYALFERPMLFFAYDIDTYVDWRGFYYPYEEFVPGPIFNNTAEIVAYIQDIDTTFNKQKVVDFKEKFMRSCDGHSTERIASIVLNHGA